MKQIEVPPHHSLFISDCLTEIGLGLLDILPVGRDSTRRIDKYPLSIQSRVNQINILTYFK